ncbi:MAG: hypothetical protein AMXMBFR33_41390 [Candidatus Xenobia bacterium]
MTVTPLPLRPIPHRDPRVAAAYHRMLELLAGSSYETHPAVREARRLASHQAGDSWECALRWPLPDCALEDPDRGVHGELLTLLADPPDLEALERHFPDWPNRWEGLQQRDQGMRLARALAEYVRLTERIRPSAPDRLPLTLARRLEAAILAEVEEVLP